MPADTETRWKRMQREALIRFVIAWVRVLRWTSRTYEQPTGFVDRLRHTDAKGRTLGLIGAAWHGRHSATLMRRGQEPVVIITSRSKDGELLDRILRALGHDTVRGSSSRGGVAALTEMARRVRRGTHAVIAVDGPKGPREIVKPGILTLAKITGSPILPMVCAVHRGVTFPKAWDRFTMTMPGSRNLLLYGEPMRIPRDTPDEALPTLADELKQRMDRLHAMADEAVKSAAGCKKLIDEQHQAMESWLAQHHRPVD